MPRKTAADYDPRVLELYDALVHGKLDRRGFAQHASKYLTAGVTAEVVLQSLLPNYALAQQVAPDDPRIEAETFAYDSPNGGGKISGLLAHPKQAGTKFPAVLVIHENRGLNPYIQDVARRLAVAGFLALAPDALSPLGGYPGNDEDGRALQAKRKGEEMTEDFMAAAKTLQTHPLSTGKVGAVGFCFGGGMVNELAVRIPDVLQAGVPFYGRQPMARDVNKIKAALLIHYAELDERINAGWPDFEAALKEHHIQYEAHMYPKVNHGFHNDSTPRYDEAAAKLAWERTLEFFKKHLA